MLIPCQNSYCLGSTMETLKNNVPKTGKNVARKSTSNRPLKNIPNLNSGRTEDSALHSKTIVNLSPCQANNYVNRESVRYTAPQAYHFSNSARYSDNLSNKAGIIQESFVDDSEEECNNIDGVFSISGSMMKYLKEAQLSPSLSDDSDDALDLNRVRNFPVKYEFPSYAIKKKIPSYSDVLYISEDSEVSDSDNIDAQPSSNKKNSESLITTIKDKSNVKKELSFSDCNVLSNFSVNTEETDNENISELRNVDLTDNGDNENSLNIKIEIIKTLTNKDITDDELDWSTVSGIVPLKETNVEKQTIIDEETNVGEKTVIDEEANVVEKTIKGETNIRELTFINKELNVSKETHADTVANAHNKNYFEKETNDETTQRKITPSLNKGKITKQKKSQVLPKRATRSTNIKLISDTLEESLVKRVPFDRRSKQRKGVIPPTSKRRRPFSNRRSKANLNLAEDSSDNSDLSLSSSDANESNAVIDKNKQKSTAKAKPEDILEKSKSQNKQNSEPEVASNPEKSKETKKVEKKKPEINEGILLHVEAAKKTDIMRDGKILKDKKDLLKDIDSTIDKNLPLEVDKQDFEIQQSLTEEILLDQALRLAHQRTSPRRRPLLTTSQAKEIVNTLTSRSTRRKSTEKKASNSLESPGKQKRSNDTNSTEADLSNTAETESDSEIKKVSNIDETSPITNNRRGQGKKSDKSKKINIKNILKKMADTLDPDNVDINSLSKTFENVIKNISTLTNSSNSEPSDTDTAEEKIVNTKAKKKTKTRKKVKSTSAKECTQKSLAIGKTESPVTDDEDLIPVIIIKNKNEAFIRKRSQRISKSISNKDEDHDLPPSNPEKVACDSLNEISISEDKATISEESKMEISPHESSIVKISTSVDVQYDKKKLILDDSCRSLVIDESLNESSLNLEHKNVMDSAALPEPSNDEVTSTTEFDKSENNNKEGDSIIIEDSPASPDEVYMPTESPKSEVVEIIEIDDVEVDSSTKNVEPIPFLDSCDTTVSETRNDSSKDDSSQMSINSLNSDAIKKIIHTPEITNSSPTKLGISSIPQQNLDYTSGSSSDKSADSQKETTTDQAVVANTALLGNSGLPIPLSVQNPSIQPSALSFLQNPVVVSNNSSPAMQVFPPAISSGGVFSLSSDATQITTSIVTTSTLLQHISQQSLTSSINPLDPAFNNTNAQLANYFNQNQQKFQYPLAANSLQYSSSTASSEITQIAQTNAKPSPTTQEDSKPVTKSIDVPLSILARDPRLRKKSVRIIMDNVEFTASASSSNPPAPITSTDPKSLITPRASPASLASATPKVQAVAPFSKQPDPGEKESDEPECITQEDIIPEEKTETRPDSPVLEIPKKKSKKKEVDKELLYKTPLCDLHEETSERSSYSRNPKRAASSRFETHRQSEVERPSYTHHEPYREYTDRSYRQRSDSINYHGINLEHYNEETREHLSIAFRKEKAEGHRRQEEFSQHSRRPDHYSRWDYDDSKRRDPSDRRPLLDNPFGSYNQRYKDSSYPRYDYAHKKVGGKFPSHIEPDGEGGQSSSRPYSRRRRNEELFQRRWESLEGDWRHMRSLSFPRAKRVDKPHGPGRGLMELESPLSPDQEPPLYQ